MEHINITNIHHTALHVMPVLTSHEKPVCLSVCLSVKRVDCDKTKGKFCPDFFIPYARSFIV